MGEILVGVDGSEASSRALSWALDEARRRDDASLVVVHAYAPPQSRRPYAYADAYMPADVLQRLIDEDRQWHEEQEQAAHRHAEALVEEMVDRLGAESPDVAIRRLLVAREPAEMLVEMSDDADLLVLGTRGRGGFKGLLLGSVSQQCIQHARCPVVVVP